MESQLGWVHFSREALRRAEARLEEGQQGVRDEVGFLLLYQAYADRFFPGTSVLQTRLRYIFFLPWCTTAWPADAGRCGICVSCTAWRWRRRPGRISWNSWMSVSGSLSSRELAA